MLNVFKKLSISTILSLTLSSQALWAFDMNETKKCMKELEGIHTQNIPGKVVVHGDYLGEVACINYWGSFLVSSSHFLTVLNKDGSETKSLYVIMNNKEKVLSVEMHADIESLRRPHSGVKQGLGFEFYISQEKDSEVFHSEIGRITIQDLDIRITTKGK